VTAALFRFVALPLREQARTVEAALWLLVVRAVFALLPLRRALRLFRITEGEGSTGRIAAPAAAAVGRAITRAARNVPFRAVCLQQAFAALLMLRRRGLAATIHLGAARTDTGSLKAHAWSRCGDVQVTGFAAARAFVPVAAFRASAT
jgi:transglutaminase superfamily protein